MTNWTLEAIESLPQDRLEKIYAEGIQFSKEHIRALLQIELVRFALDEKPKKKASNAKALQKSSLQG